MKAIPHIKKSQKKRIMKLLGKPCYATYPKDKDLYEALGVPDSIPKIVIWEQEIIQEKQKKSDLAKELEGLGFKVLPKSEITPLRFKVPVSAKNHKKTVEEIQNLMNLTQKELADIIGCSPRKIWSILNVENECFKRKGDINNFNQLVNLINQLLGIFKEKTLKTWIKTSQKDLGNKKPINLFISGNIEPLRNWIYGQLEGTYQ